MIVPGPKVEYTLQELPESRTGTGGDTGTWSDVTTFRGSLGPVSTQEANRFEREAVTSTHLAIIGSEEVGDAFVTSLIEENRLVIANTENPLASETFDITGVQPFRYPGNQIATYEVMLRKVV